MSCENSLDRTLCFCFSSASPEIVPGRNSSAGQAWARGSLPGRKRWVSIVIGAILKQEGSGLHMKRLKGERDSFPKRKKEIRTPLKKVQHCIAEIRSKKGMFQNRKASSREITCPPQCTWEASTLFFDVLKSSMASAFAKSLDRGNATLLQMHG